MRLYQTYDCYVISKTMSLWSCSRVTLSTQYSQSRFYVTVLKLNAIQSSPNTDKKECERKRITIISSVKKYVVAIQWRKVREYHRCKTQKARHCHGLGCTAIAMNDGNVISIVPMITREARKKRALDLVLLLNSQDKVKVFTNYLNHSECVDREHKNVTNPFMQNCYRQSYKNSFIEKCLLSCFQLYARFILDFCN